jgi:hypothetical protein
MKAALLQKSRVVLGRNRFAEISIWQLPTPVGGSHHTFKYHLALVIDGAYVLRYDNEAGRSDHKHLGAREVPYAFDTLDRLIDDFWADVARL